MTTSPTPFTQLFGIPEEEFASVKDSVTSGLPSRGHGEGVEASGSSGYLVIPEIRFTKGYVAEDDDVEDIKKTAFAPQQTKQKGKLSMGPMVESSWK